ncbi:MAG: hypothetical protein ABIA37_02185 [Candidatus Woesearchaeota archaeon]|nr:hypothetical protein [Nanoarchaeota archaeon]MBU1644148.1 hypothetical protein [Nanoarchaeota archaeon]MBU1976713.1 hypothetical protein [Nanoarchaeota archaeon]
MATYDDFKLEQYVNTNPVGRIGDETIFLRDVILGMEFSKLNGILRGPKSSGKTQLMRDIYNGHFGGDEHALWEMGRTDFRPKDLFEKLNLSVARGGYSSLPEIRTAYKDGRIRHLISTFEVDKSGQISPQWKEITEREVKQILEIHSTTSDQLVQLKNIEKNFFTIDEYNRCPEVIMNLFYGLMTGEINHEGKIIRLGDGYYSGLAAVNPEDYEGTFKMDAAMWARFHVAVDFAAYPITVADKDELNQRNLSPDVHNSSLRDLTKNIFAIYEKVRSKQPTFEERLILQYFQSGLDLCTEAGRSKELLDWPRHCASKGCSKHTKICGTVKGLDARAIRAVYRLAKGLEEVVRLKMDREDIEINPVDSFSLAYQFVAPYKGVLHPKEVKEARGIEALVLAEKMPSIRTNLADVIESMNKSLLILGKKSGQKEVTATKKNFRELGQESEYDKVLDNVEKKYTVRRKLSFEEVAQEIPQIYEAMLKKTFSAAVQTGLIDHEPGILAFLKQQNEALYTQLITLKKGISKKDYNNLPVPKEKKVSLEEINKKMNDRYTSILSQVVETVFCSSGALVAAESLSIPVDKIATMVKKAQKELPDKEIEYVPEDKKQQYETEKGLRLRKKLAEIIAEQHKAELEKHLKGEKSFLSYFVAEEMKNGN